MKEIDQYIRKQTREYKRKATIHLNKIKDNSILLQKLKDDYNQWLYDLKHLMRNGLCRQVLKDIEEKKYKYDLLKNELWKYRLIKAKAILKIIKIKIKRHSKEVIIDNSTQNRSLKFWFNQIFLTLEELILEFRYDINQHMDYKSKKIIEPVQAIIEYHLEYIYYLCIFSIKINEVIPLIAYLSITSKFVPYIPFFSKSKLLSLFENIILFKIKLFIENCNYISALDNIKIVLTICFREMHIFMNFDTEIDIKSLSTFSNKDKEINKPIANFCAIIKKIVLAYFLRGVACEHLGFFIESIKAYKECRWYSNYYLFDYDKELFKFFRILERKYTFYKIIFDDIHKHYSNKNKKENEKNKNNTNNTKIFITKKYLSSYRNNRYKGTSITVNTNKSKYKSTIQFRSTSINSPKKRQKLENLLQKIGTNLYKEEENRNNSIFKKYNKNTFALSTVKMINNLLSDQFNHILKKMDKVEITKPQEEINHLINWTIYFQRQKEFKNYLIQSKEKPKQKRLRNKSCITFKNQHPQNIFRTKDKEPIKIIKNSEFFKKYTQNIEKPYTKLSKSQTTKSKINKLDNIFKFKPEILLSSKNNQSNKNINHKILKYPLNKDVFSKSLLNKKNYLDSIYEKELNFQKKLLKLKGYDMEKVSTEFNQQKAINSAEQDFKIIRCFAESKNSKKNLINLVKNTGEDVLETMFPDKKLRNRSNTALDIKKLKNYMLINNISLIKERYEPNKVKKYNEEKSKMLNMECAKLEELQNKYIAKRKILMNKGIRNKRKIDINY